MWCRSFNIYTVFVKANFLLIKIFASGDRDPSWNYVIFRWGILHKIVLGPMTLNVTNSDCGWVIGERLTVQGRRKTDFISKMS